MRIIAGSARGRRLQTLPGRSIRPTSDRVREAIFNMIQPDVTGADVLDLFAGSGAFACEALSRGARSATLIDRSARALSMAKRNLETTGLVHRAHCLRMDAKRAIGKLHEQARRFDIAFLDPPYDDDLLEQGCSCLLDSEVMRPHSILITEMSTRQRPPELGSADRYLERTYGRTRIALYRLKES